MATHQFKMIPLVAIGMRSLFRGLMKRGRGALLECLSCGCILSAVVFFAPLPLSHAADVELIWAMDQDPKVVIPPPRQIFAKRNKSLWIDALGQPDTDLQRQAADTITRAHQMGMPGLDEAAAPLLRVLDAADRHPVVRLAAAQALVALDARESAPSLIRHSRNEGSAFAQLVEPALAKWDYAAARTEWLDRLAEPNATTARLRLAIHSLGVVHETKATARLQALVESSGTNSGTRLAAARALSQIHQTTLEQLAGELAARPLSPDLMDRLVAASLLRHHRGALAESLLLKLAVDPAPSVQDIALTRLLEFNPASVFAIVDQIIGSPDAKVRHAAARALVIQADISSIAKLGPMLDDRHPDVRNFVRRSLQELAAQPQLKQAVLDQLVQMLGTEHWRGLEQASLLAVGLDYKPAARRIAELLDFKRAEVFVTAAWALRNLAVPQTLDAMLGKVEREVERSFANQVTRDEVDLQVSFLMEAFGLMKFECAIPVMRRSVPKDYSLGFEMRAAAIWSLGHLYDGEGPPDLAAELINRVRDLSSIMPESDRVKQMAAVTLGRMKANESLRALREFYSGRVTTPYDHAFGWAIHQLTGEPIPAAEPLIIMQSGWFLESID